MHWLNDQIIPYLRHGSEGEIFLIIVDQPGWTLRYVVETEGEWNQEDESSQTQPVPGETATHEVADEDTESCHDLREGTTDVSHVLSGGLVNIDRNNGHL